MNNSNLMPASDPIIGLDRWSSTVSETFCPMSCDRSGDKTPDTFIGKLSNTHFNRIQLSCVSTHALKVFRGKGDIAQASDAYYLAKFQISGESIVQQCGRNAHLKPGDFVICSSSEPYQLHFPTDYFQAVLSIPQPLLREVFNGSDNFLGIKMGGESPVHSLLSQFVISLIQRLDILEPSIIKRLEFNLLELLITSLHAEAGNTPSPVNAPHQHLQHIKSFIGTHLNNPDLSPEFIATAEGISKRYLHMLFKEQGFSVSRYIQNLRLEASHRALTNPRMQHLSAAEIALNCGFGDISHFHRCFKAHYQLTPRQLRLQAQTTENTGAQTKSRL